MKKTDDLVIISIDARVSLSSHDKHESSYVTDALFSRISKRKDYLYDEIYEYLNRKIHNDYSSKQRHVNNIDFNISKNYKDFNFHCIIEVSTEYGYGEIDPYHEKRTAQEASFL